MWCWQWSAANLSFMIHYVAKSPTIEPDFFWAFLRFFSSSSQWVKERSSAFCAMNNKKLRSFVFFLRNCPTLVRRLLFSQACQSVFSFVFVKKGSCNNKTQDLRRKIVDGTSDHQWVQNFQQSMIKSFSLSFNSSLFQLENWIESSRYLEARECIRWFPMASSFAAIFDLMMRIILRNLLIKLCSIYQKKFYETICWSFMNHL